MSPPILVRSGYWASRSTGYSLGITPIVYQSNIGKRLQDHATISLWISMDSSETNLFDLSTEIVKYATSRTGEFSTIMSIHMILFINTSGNETEPEFVIYYFWLQKNSLNTGIFLKTLDYKKEYADQIMEINKTKDLLVIGMSILNPKSFGSVTTNSTSPFNYPKIVANYLQEEDDLLKAISGLKGQFSLLETESFKKVNATVIQFDLHDGNVFNSTSKDSLRTYAKHIVQTIWHPSGTCSMGTSADHAVVDPQLRVFGVDSLRVADASLMPKIVSGNLIAPVYMIAEKAAYMIRQNSCSPYQY